MATTLMVTGQKDFIEAKLPRLALFHRMLLDSTICMEIFGNGAKIFGKIVIIIILLYRLMKLRKNVRKKSGMYYGVVRGSTIR